MRSQLVILIASLFFGLLAWVICAGDVLSDTKNSLMRELYAACGRIGVQGAEQASETRTPGGGFYMVGRRALPVWIDAFEGYVLPNIAMAAALGISLMCYHGMAFPGYRRPRCSSCSEVLMNLKEPGCPKCGARL